MDGVRDETVVAGDRLPVTEPRVLLGAPVAAGAVSHHFMHSVLALQRHFDRLGWGLEVVTRSDALVTRSRNTFAGMAVQDPTVTHLLMMDSDIAVSPGVVERLVRSGHEVCGAIAPKREVDWARVRQMLDGEPCLTAGELASLSHGHVVWFERPGGARRAVGGFIPVEALGTPVFLVSRSSLVTMADSALVHRYEGDAVQSGSWTFFDPFVDAEGRYLSEDYAFCHRWRALGGTVWADIRSPVRHVGPVAVDGDVASALSAASRLAESGRPRRQPREDT